MRARFRFNDAPLPLSGSRYFPDSGTSPVSGEGPAYGPGPGGDMTTGGWRLIQTFPANSGAYFTLGTAGGETQLWNVPAYAAGDLDVGQTMGTRSGEEVGERRPAPTGDAARDRLRDAMYVGDVRTRATLRAMNARAKQMSQQAAATFRSRGR